MTVADKQPAVIKTSSEFENLRVISEKEGDSSWSGFYCDSSSKAGDQGMSESVKTTEIYTTSRF